MSMNTIMPCGNYYGLPDMFSRTEQMMMPFVQDYANAVSQMDFENEFVIPARTYSYNPGASGTGTGGSVFNMDEHLEKLRENQQKMREYNMQRQIQDRQDALVQMAPMDRLGAAAQDLKTKIIENEQDQIPQALNGYLDAVRAAYDPEGKADDATIMAKARILYQQQTRSNLLDDIKANGHSPFMQGFINTFSLGLFKQNTPDETISKITGQPVSTSSSNSKNLGKAAGVASWTAIGAGVGSVVPGVGTTLGACVGFGIGVLSSIFG